MPVILRGLNARQAPTAAPLSRPPTLPQVPFYAATLARARLQRAHERLAESLRDVAARADAWPPARVLLLLKLFATVFPASGEPRVVADAAPSSIYMYLLLAIF